LTFLLSYRKSRISLKSI